MEEKTTCPCVLKQDDSCFVEKTEVNNKPFESFMCFKCGWTTDSYLEIGADAQIKREHSHSRLINELKIVDYDRKLVWYPAVINMGPKRGIYICIKMLLSRFVVCKILIRLLIFDH